MSSKTEQNIQKEIMLELSRVGCTIWRNNTGAYKTPDGAYIKFGLCVGSSDIIGICEGRFLAVEVKTKTGRASDKQLNFIAAVKRAGGIAFIARSAEEALIKLGEQM